jgi:hypothetical protein
MTRSQVMYVINISVIGEGVVDIFKSHVEKGSSLLTPGRDPGFESQPGNQVVGRYTYMTIHNMYISSEGLRQIIGKNNIQLLSQCFESTTRTFFKL